MKPTVVRCSSPPCTQTCTCKSEEPENRDCFYRKKTGQRAEGKREETSSQTQLHSQWWDHFAKQLHFITAPTQHISINRQCQTTTHSNNSSLQNTHPQLSALAVQINENVSLYKERNIFRCEIACRLGECVSVSEVRTACFISNLVSHCYHYHPFPPSLFPLLSYSLAGHSFTLVKR